MKQFRDYLEAIKEKQPIGIKNKLFSEIENYLNSKTIYVILGGDVIDIIPSEEGEDSNGKFHPEVTKEELTNNILKISKKILNVNFSKQFKDKLKQYIGSRNKETTGNSFDDALGWHVERKINDSIKYNLVIDDLVNMILNYKSISEV